jgi:hypothetical protein
MYSRTVFLLDQSLCPTYQLIDGLYFCPTTARIVNSSGMRV